MEIGKEVIENLSTSECSFLRGYNQLSHKQKLEFEFRVTQMLNYTSQSTFRKRLVGDWPKSHRDIAMKAVENLFKEYGITDVWGL